MFGQSGFRDSSVLTVLHRHLAPRDGDMLGMVGTMDNLQPLRTVRLWSTAVMDKL